MRAGADTTVDRSHDRTFIVLEIFSKASRVESIDVKMRGMIDMHSVAAT